MKKFKILIVEDEEMLLELFEMLITSEFQCEITTASNGLEAMEFLKLDSDFNLIISDYKMPKANGGDLYHFNSTRHNLPFFLFSGGDLADYSEFSNFHTINTHNRFFNKPFNEKYLIAEIKYLYDLKS
jgi:YesN/AraC family two-component response regulator